MLGEYLNVYKEAELRLYEFGLLVLIYEDNQEFLETIHERNFIDYNNGIHYLEYMGYAKWFGDKPADIMLRKAGENLFKKHIVRKKKIVKSGTFVHIWIDEWRELFPKGSNTGGYRYRGNRLDALKKMVKFVDAYDFTTEEIFKATKNYVDKFAMRGYAYMQQAHYFIDKKDSGSSLASECEGMRETNVEQVNKEPKHGERLI
jgi:hypothetical protein